jgi:hypothetical protein
LSESVARQHPSIGRFHPIVLQGRVELLTEFAGHSIVETGPSSTEPWGINVISVEVKDVLIPPALEDAMSMQAPYRQSAHFGPRGEDFMVVQRLQ